RRATRAAPLDYRPALRQCGGLPRHALWAGAQARAGGTRVADRIAPPGIRDAVARTLRWQRHGRTGAVRFLIRWRGGRLALPNQLSTFNAQRSTLNYSRRNRGFPRSPRAASTNPMRPPEVSVLMPVFNAAQDIGRAIDSIRQQSLRNWELIIVDDGSTDGTQDILRRITACEPRLRIIALSHGGIVSALNAGLA